MKLQRCDPRPFVCGHSAEIITLLFFVFRAKFLCGNDKKKSNYNYKCSKSFKLLHCEQWSVYTWNFFFWGGGAVSILCFYVVGPWIRSNKTLPLTESLLRWLRGLCCYLYICQVRKQITLSLFFWWSFKHARLSLPLIYFIWRRRNQGLTCIYTFRDYC